MKKILFLFVLCLGLCSFTSPDLNAKSDSLSAMEIDQLSNPFQITVDFDINEDDLYVCTAYVFYNGVPHGQVQGYGSTPEAACDQAYQSAVFYIRAYGGEYP